MRAVNGASTEDPLRRLLAGTAGALRARRQLPPRDPRRASSRWLRPNWPDDLLLSVHRGRLVDALMHDVALRKEVRNRLSIPAMDDLASIASGSGAPTEVGELLAAAITAAEDPAAVLESAATDANPVVAGAAAPYLRGEAPLPLAGPRQPVATDKSSAAGVEREHQLRRRAREADQEAKSDGS